MAFRTLSFQDIQPSKITPRALDLPALCGPFNLLKPKALYSVSFVT